MENQSEITSTDNHRESSNVNSLVTLVITILGLLTLFLALLSAYLFVQNGKLKSELKLLNNQLRTNSILPNKTNNEIQDKLDFTNQDIKSYFPSIDNFDQFYLTKRGYSPNKDYYLVGIDFGSPIPNREEIQGNWIIDLKTNSAKRIMRNEANHLFVSAFYDWVGEYKVAFKDQLSPNWATGNEQDYVIYDIKTGQLSEVSRKDVLPPVTDMRSFGNQEFEVEFVAPYRSYPKYSQIVKDGWANLCEDLNLTRTTDPVFTEHVIKSDSEVYLQGTLFDLKVNTSDGSFQVYSHDQDSMLRDACVTQTEYQEVIDSIKVISTSN